MSDVVRTDESSAESESELAVVVEPEGLLVAGDQSSVQMFLDKLRFNAVSAIEVAGVDSQSLAGTAALAAGLAAMGAQHGTFVRLAPESVDLMKKFHVIPGNPGFNRMMVADAAGKFRGQMQWQQASLAGTRALSIQLTVAVIALQTAIAETTHAVERVEGKVDAILNLAKASVIGDVVGHHQSLKRTVHTLDETGKLPSADWDSIAPLGPNLEVVVEKLRAHIRLTVEGFDAAKPVQDRASYLKKAVEDNRLGETLELLVIAEDSLYLWQRLRIERVRQTEPENLELVIATARQMLAEHLTADGELLLRGRTELAHYAAIKPLEIVRWMSSGQLKRDIVQLREDLDSFATARRSQVQGWQDHEDPGIGDALAELGNHFKSFGGSALALGSRGVDAGAAGLGFLGRKIKQVAEPAKENAFSPEDKRS
ncbi:hypothetical protein OPAG_00230 [Rhodococcus opacus PD630]|uniref:hypothetical protein n=1 Tax=Rhodococcus opacus TaxID=37919 RepID=UPI00029CB919|nr:hypothetical protein [Rhodococcus opacus]AHK33026.1 hypothetical protein Pd630_LPD05835 [Rhodococcus opacus PD630]EHI41020.1 hypothetical protein OPAG_00230 [Rhodococcus opacus PD630]UDG95344.1 hypothetical protein K2Z90_005478 [Rhodococcus opacus PD630]